MENSISSEGENCTKNIDKETDLCEEKMLSESDERSDKEDDNVNKVKDKVNSWINCMVRIS